MEEITTTTESTSLVSWEYLNYIRPVQTENTSTTTTINTLIWTTDDGDNLEFGDKLDGDTTTLKSEIQPQPVFHVYAPVTTLAPEIISAPAATTPAQEIISAPSSGNAATTLAQEIISAPSSSNSEGKLIEEERRQDIVPVLNGRKFYGDFYTWDQFSDY